MKTTLIGFLAVVVLAVAVAAAGQESKRIASSEAAQHVGEQATVCGTVESTRYVSNSRTKPTFLNVGKPYPDQEFTVVIWHEDLTKFGRPKDKFLHKAICATGRIKSYRGKPEIVARTSNQIAIE